MDTSFGSAWCWILGIAVIFASVQRSDGQWLRQPATPTIVVEGVNSSLVRLKWEFRVLNQGETLNAILIQRERPDRTERTTIAAKSGVRPFKVADGFRNGYRALPPLTLEVLNVDNTKEYYYTVQYQYNKNNDLVVVPSEVRVIVNVPPRITEEPKRFSRKNAGENFNLTCNASGDPMPNITWSREGATTNQLVNATGHTLSFVNVQKQDVGSYRCTANNGYGTASSLAIVNVICSQCETIRVGITITAGAVWTDSLRNPVSIEYKMLASNLTSAIVTPYSRPENQGKQLHDVAIEEFRNGSVIAIVQMQFPSSIRDPLEPLQREVNGRRLGIFTVNTKLDINPRFSLVFSTTGKRAFQTATVPPTSTTGSAASKEPPSDPAARTGLSDAAMWGIIGGCIAFALLVAIVILVCCLCRGGRCSCCRRTKSSGGATKGKKYTEADGYRMNRQPPPSGLGTASPAYVEARMYAPAHATKRQDDQTKYADLSFDQSSKPPPRYGSEVDYADVSPSKRPPPAAGGGGGQGEGGFELWC